MTHFVEVMNVFGSMNTKYSYRNLKKLYDPFIPQQQFSLGWHQLSELSISVATAHAQLPIIV